MLLVGIDLAWGEKNSDGVCFLRYEDARATVLGYDYPHGDEALLQSFCDRRDSGENVFLAIDAPIICPNAGGQRPVDGEVSRRFRAEHAGCYPANRRLARRPIRIGQKLQALGYALTPEFRPNALSAAEVFPHPAMVHLLGLPQIVKYKRKPGRARVESDAEFARLQRLIRESLVVQFPFLALDADTPALLAAPWTKPVEDRIDALFCALIALWHVHYAGARSEIIGDLTTGFILLPADLRPAAP
jgi:predicted RNase H-like nuclease